jgi:hypothetical protein
VSLALSLFRSDVACLFIQPAEDVFDLWFQILLNKLEKWYDWPADSGKFETRRVVIKLRNLNRYLPAKVLILRDHSAFDPEIIPLQLETIQRLG